MSVLSPKFDLPQGTLDLLLLKIIAVEPTHGYAIAQRLQQISREIVQVPLGSLYPALHRLENRGLVKSEWKETDSGRDAKFYRLTNKGRAHLNAQAAKWRRLAEAVGLILSLAEEGARWPSVGPHIAVVRWGTPRSSRNLKNHWAALDCAEKRPAKRQHS